MRTTLRDRMMDNGPWPDGVSGYNPTTGHIIYSVDGESRSADVDRSLAGGDLRDGRLILPTGMYLVDDGGQLVFRHHNDAVD